MVKISLITLLFLLSDSEELKPAHVRVCPFILKAKFEISQIIQRMFWDTDKS